MPTDTTQTREELLHELARVLVHAHRFNEVPPQDGDILYAAVLLLSPTSDPYEVESLRHALQYLVGARRSLDVPAVLVMLGLSTEQKPDLRTGEPKYLALQDRGWFPDRLPNVPRPAWFPVELEDAAVRIRDADLFAAVHGMIAKATSFPPYFEVHYAVMRGELAWRAKDRDTDIISELRRALRRAASSRVAPPGWVGGQWSELLAGWTGPWLWEAVADDLAPGVRLGEIPQDEEPPTAHEHSIGVMVNALRSPARRRFILLFDLNMAIGVSDANAKRDAALQAWPEATPEQAIANADRTISDLRKQGLL